MSLHLYEHEVKDIFRENGLPVPRGQVVSEAEQAARVAEKLGGPVVIKGQVLTGSRGKNGAIAFAETPAQAEVETRRLLGIKVNGWPLHQVLIEDRLDIEKEFYLAATIAPNGNSPILVSSPRGGMEVEEIAEYTPEQLRIENVDIFRGPGQYHGRNLLTDFGLNGRQLLQGSSIALKLYEIFTRYYAELVEINPLVLTREGDLVAADAKLGIDINGYAFLKEFAKTRDRFQSDQAFEAAQHGLTYVKLEGSIGVACTGAGLTLATLDMIKEQGGEPANFLEFGGATYGNAYHALRVILSDPDVKVVLINTFGLVARADVIAQGLVEAIAALRPKVPIVATVRGTGEKKARELLWEGAGIESLQSTQAVVEAAVQIAGGGMG